MQCYWKSYIIRLLSLYRLLIVPTSPLLRRNIKNLVTLLQFHHQVFERLVCPNPLSDWLPVDALVIRVEVDKRSIHSLSRVLYPILSEHPQVGLTLDDLPKHVDAVRYVFGNGLVVLAKVVPWVVGAGVVVVVEEDGLADHVEAVQVVVELEQDWKVARRGFEMVWTNAGTDCLGPGQDERL